MDRKIKKKRFGLKQLSWLAFLSAIAALGVYYFVFQDTSARLNVKTEKIIVSTVTNEPFQEFIPVLGEVLPVTTVYLDAIEGGRVEKKFVEAGAWVKKGDKLLHLSNTNLVISIMQRESEYAIQKDSLQKSELSLEQKKLGHVTLMAELDYQLTAKTREYNKSKSLFEKEIISKNKYLVDKENYEYLIKKKRLTQENFIQEMNIRKVQLVQLAASLERAAANLEVIRKKMDALTIRAPITGQLTTLNAEIGESKLPGQRLGQINDMDKLKVVAGIDEHYIARVKEGKTGTFDFDSKISELEITKILPNVKDGKFQAELMFVEKPPEGIKVGQTAHIKLTLGDLSNVLTLPRGGFFQSTAGQWIFVLDPSGDFASRRSIRLGRKNTAVFEVLAGLKTGEKVITSGYENYGDMDKLVLQ